MAVVNQSALQKRLARLGDTAGRMLRTHTCFLHTNIEGSKSDRPRAGRVRIAIENMKENAAPIGMSAMYHSCLEKKTREVAIIH